MKKLQETKYYNYLKEQLRDMDKKIEKLEKNSDSWDDILINISGLNFWIKDKFDNNIVSINDMIRVIEDLIIDVERLEEKIEDMEREDDPEPELLNSDYWRYE